MLLLSLSLTNFRNFKEASFEFDSKVTIVLGENARGKTNILEAIYFVMNGVGFRETKEKELMHWDMNHATVTASFLEAANQLTFRIYLREHEGGSIEKVFFINKAKKKHVAYSRDIPKAVLFAPEQIAIVTGRPEERRRYLDKMISLYDPEYRKRVMNYENALRKRNKVFEMYRDPVKLEEELEFWNTYLIEQASYITKKREAYIAFLNDHEKVDSVEFSAVYLKNEFTRERLKGVFELEQRVRRTMIGPQKDDFEMYHQSGKVRKNLHFFGSRSEQRLGVFWLKLNELLMCEEFLKVKPILLLDDVFSELDSKNKKLVFALISKYQTVITTTDLDLPSGLGSSKKIIEV